MIRLFRTADAESLAFIHAPVFPDDALPPAAFANMIAAHQAAGDRVWVISQDGPVGYALAAAVPGLPHLAELSGGVASEWRRKGLGTLLLQRVIVDLQGGSHSQLSHAVVDMNGTSAQFLLKRGFTIEHEEWLLEHLNPPLARARPTPDAVTINRLARPEALAEFDRLYNLSFGGLPWNQPFEKEELEGAGHTAGDLLFISHESDPVGFAWMHLTHKQSGVIEPLGIIPQFQGRGYGRLLLQAAVDELVRLGAHAIQIGAWKNNSAAIGLYQSLGFEHVATVTYLSYDLAGAQRDSGG